MTLVLYFIHYRDSDGQDMDQHVFAESAEKAVQLWLGDGGLMSDMGLTCKADPDGDVFVWELPTAATEPIALGWSHHKAMKFSLDEP